MYRLLHIPDLVTELLQLRLVVWIELLLRLDENTVLEAPAAEHQTCVHVGVLHQDRLYSRSVVSHCDLSLPSTTYQEVQGWSTMQSK